MTEPNIPVANETSPCSPLDPLDQPIWGAKAIAKAANLFTDTGKPDERKAFYLLGIGALPGAKVGDTWVTTPRRLRDRFNEQVEVETLRAAQPSGRGRKKHKGVG